jgi:uncharacterized membrane protein YciS (DUF1049 family)
VDYVVIGLVSFLVGFILSGIFKIDVKISKKEDYDKKVKELNEIIAGFENKETVVYRKDELFPADLNRDYGIPKDLK